MFGLQVSNGNIKPDEFNPNDVLASIGVAALFVFGFSVYNVSTPSRELDWCFYVNLVAVILAVIAAILLSIYDALLKKPIQ